MTAFDPTPLRPDAPAMPQLFISSPEPGDYRTMEEGGLTVRQYAAIALCVPDSGTPWLDALIERRRMDECADKALAAMISRSDKDNVNRGANGVSVLVGYAYEYAAAMLAASKKEPA